MFGKRLINTGGVACTTDTLQILGDTSCIATYRLNGDATDLSGNYNGTATSVTYVAGQFGDAGSFNGSSSYIDTNYTPAAISTHSVSIWFKTDISAVRRGLFSDFSSAGTGYSTRLNLGISALNKFEFVIGNGTDAWTDTTTINALPYLNGVWNNVVLVISGTSVKLYANDSLIANLTSTIAAGTAGTQSISLGRPGDYNGLYFNGSIDQVRIFNKAISASEVTTLYNEIAC